MYVSTENKKSGDAMRGGGAQSGSAAAAAAAGKTLALSPVSQLFAPLSCAAAVSDAGTPDAVLNARMRPLVRALAAWVRE